MEIVSSFVLLVGVFYFHFHKMEAYARAEEKWNSCPWTKLMERNYWSYTNISKM